MRVLIAYASVHGSTEGVAERIAALGGSPLGTVGALVENRSLPEYPLRRDTAMAHLAELDAIYDVIVADNRKAIDDVEELDLITQDMLDRRATGL